MKAWKNAVLDDSRLTQVLFGATQPAKLELRTPYFSIYNRGGFYTYETPCPQVTILPLIGRSHLVMIRARRPIVDDCPLELPAGSFFPGETPKQAAAREFGEETGIVIGDHNRFSQALPVSVMSGRCPFLDYVFEIELAQSEYEARIKHCSEVEEVLLISLDDAIHAIQTGEIYAVVPMAIIMRKYLALHYPVRNADENM